MKNIVNFIKKIYSNVMKKFHLPKSDLEALQRIISCDSGESILEWQRAHYLVSLHEGASDDDLAKHERWPTSKVLGAIWRKNFEKDGLESISMKYRSEPSDFSELSPQLRGAHLSDIWMKQVREAREARKRPI